MVFEGNFSCAHPGTDTPTATTVPTAANKIFLKSKRNVMTCPPDSTQAGMALFFFDAGGEIFSSCHRRSQLTDA
jgi:hypothetical protein